MIKKLGLVALGVCFSVSAAQAGMIVDTVNQYEKIYGWGDSHSYQHNLNDDGFVLGTAESGTIEIGITNGDWWEVILFTIEDFDFDTGGASFGSSFSNEIEAEALAELNSDGELDVTVTALTPYAKFWVGDSVLTVVTAAVPEPGTLGLFALGLAGLGFARRKTKA